MSVSLWPPQRVFETRARSCNGRSDASGWPLTQIMAHGRLFLLLAAVVPALAAPILDILADPCTGTAQPKVNSLPVCYGGKMSILGDTWSESVVLHIKEFDTATGKGFVSFDAEGASPQHCGKTPFTKNPSSQDVTVDFGHCMSGATVDAKYCSDQVCVLPTAHCRQLFARVTHRSLSSLFTPFPSRIRTRS